MPAIVRAIRQALNLVEAVAAFERAQQLAKGHFALAADDEVDAVAVCHVGFGREAGIVAADDDANAGPQRAQQFDDPQRGLALEGHDREADDVGLDLAHQPLDGFAHRSAGPGSGRRRRPCDADRRCRPASVSAPLGMRTATVGMCSNESGMDRSRTFTASALRRSPRPGTSGWPTCYTETGKLDAAESQFLYMRSARRERLGSPIHSRLLSRTAKPGLATFHRSLACASWYGPTKRTRRGR